MITQDLCLFFDTETTGLPKNFNLAFFEDPDNWPHLVQLSWIITDNFGNVLSTNNFIIKPEGFDIPQKAADLHGISNPLALERGLHLNVALDKFMHDVGLVGQVFAHNIEFDTNVVCAELRKARRYKMCNSLWNKKKRCTMLESTEFCAIEGRADLGGYKYPKLQELHTKLFGTQFDNAHNALDDVTATVKCYFKLKELGVMA